MLLAEIGVSFLAYLDFAYRHATQMGEVSPRCQLFIGSRENFAPAHASRNDSGWVLPASAKPSSSVAPAKRVSAALRTLGVCVSTWVSIVDELNP